MKKKLSLKFVDIVCQYDDIIQLIRVRNSSYNLVKYDMELINCFIFIPPYSHKVIQ